MKLRRIPGRSVAKATAKCQSPVLSSRHTVALSLRSFTLIDNMDHEQEVNDDEQDEGRKKGKEREGGRSFSRREFQNGGGLTNRAVPSVRPSQPTALCSSFPAGGGMCVKRIHELGWRLRVLSEVARSHPALPMQFQSEPREDEIKSIFSKEEEEG